MFRLKKIGFRYRRSLHFILLSSIIVMQIILLTIFYREKKNDSELKFLEEKTRYYLQAKQIFNRTKNELYESEEDLSRYIKTGNNFFIRHYYTHVDSLQYNLVSLSNAAKMNSNFLKSEGAYNFSAYGFYQNKDLSLESWTKSLGNKNSEIMSQHEKLLKENDKLLSQYNIALDLLEEKIRLATNDEHYGNKNFRKYLLALVLVVTILLVIFTNITFWYEKRLKSDQDKIQSNLDFKNRIMGMITHEIQSPLNIVSLYCKSIYKQNNDARLNDSLKLLQFTTNSVSLMSNQVLNLLKIESKKLQLNSSSFDLKGELSLTLDGIKDMVESTGNTLDFNLNVPSDITVNSDLIKIQELFYNIIGNANKFTNKGEIKVFADCIDVSPEQYKLEVIIKDNGIGVSKKDLKNVFKAYYQGEISEKVDNLGMGLGLNLCKELVEMLGGNIQITSELNLGTEVKFDIYLSKNEIATVDFECQFARQNLIMA